MNRLALILTRLALLALVLGAWEALPRLGIVNAQLLPPLSDVLAMLVNILGRPQVHEALAVTGAEIVVASSSRCRSARPLAYSSPRATISAKS